MEAKEVYKVAQIMLAAESKKREKNLVENLRNERYQRTFTDERDPPRVRGGFKPVDPEQKAAWEKLAGKGEIECPPSPPPASDELR
jgi:hypothetical protein